MPTKLNKKKKKKNRGAPPFLVPSLSSISKEKQKKETLLNLFLLLKWRIKFHGSFQQTNHFKIIKN